MSLSEIKNKLYKKKFDPNLTAHEESEFDSRQDGVDLGSENKLERLDDWQLVTPVSKEKKKKAFKVALITLSSVIAIAVVLVGVYYIRINLFKEERVIVLIAGPTEARSGKPLTYEVTYENKNIVSLEDVVLRIVHPENFKPAESSAYQEESPTVSLVKIGRIKGKSSGKIVFSGASYAPKGALAYLKVEMTYKPSNFSMDFVSKHQLGVNITSTPITLEVLAPQDLASGDVLDYQINYRNTGAEDFENIRIKADFPEGFTFTKAEPSVAEVNNIWYIGHLPAGEGGKIVISGRLQGERGLAKSFKAHLGIMNQGQFMSYNEESVTTRMAASPLSISQTVNDSANYYPNAGENLRFEIKYRNDGDLGLKNLIVTEKLDSPILDYASIKFERGGSYDTSSQMLVWKASDHERLASLDPGQEGSIRFSIRVKELLPINTADDKNFVVSSIVKIDSPDIPTPINMNKFIAGNRLDMKLNSKIIMLISGFYADAHIENFGPIPPVVGQETTYTINLRAGNVSNDVTDAKVAIVLPTGVVATGKLYPSDADITYNERTNQIVWNIGTIRAGEGILTPFRETAFQLKIKPSPDQAGGVVDILKETAFSAKDSFTGENLAVETANKTTMLKEDNTIKATGWKVAP